MAKSTTTLVHSSAGGSLAKYDPQKGVKQIAVAEMAEKHYAKAKDATKLVSAIRAKLEAQADFVLWWDTHGPGKEGKGNVSDRKHYSGLNGLPDRLTVHRWRAKLNDPDRFEQTFEAVCAKYPKLLEFMTTAHVGHNSGENEWYTPAEYIEAARVVLGEIDLDPATTDEANRLVKAAQIFTASENGLYQPWHGRVWMNPPYSQPLVQQFADKLVQSLKSGDVTSAVVLINNATETEFFQTLASASAAICFPKGRVRFWSPGKESATPLQGQALMYAGQNIDAFITEFRQFGFVATILRLSV